MVRRHPEKRCIEYWVSPLLTFARVGLFFWLSVRANQEGAHWRMNGKIVGLLNHSRVPLVIVWLAAIGGQPLHHLEFS
jgi:hypothetical protein